MAYIKQLKNGKWTCRVSFGGRKNRIQKSKRFRTLGAAKSWARKMEDRYEQGKPLDKPNMTLHDYLAWWLENVATMKVRTRTLQSYSRIVRLYIYESKVAKKQLSCVRFSDIQTIVNRMINRDLSPRTVRYMNAVLKSALEYAVDAEYLTKNPCKSKRLVLPKEKRKEIIVLNQEEVARFVAACRQHPLGIVLETFLELGVRISECFAIRWEDVNFTDQSIKINQSVFYSEGGKVIFDEPKTDLARRVVPISDTLRERLMAHRIKQNSKRLEHGYDNNPNNLVFPNNAGMPLRIDNFRNRVYRPILKTASITKRIPLKNLRHTSASLLAQDGHSIKIIQSRLGHADISTTLRYYAEFSGEQQDAAVTSLENIMRAEK